MAVDTSINTLLLVFIAVLLLVIGFFLREALVSKGAESVVMEGPSTMPPVIVNVPRGGDDRYTMAPQPLRRWDTSPSARMLDPIPTRGYPDEYQSMGVIKGADGKVLPLYGRRTAPRSDRFNYYTRTDTYNPVPLPVSFKKRDCQDQVGCEEMSDGDTIRIQGTDDVGTVKLYRFDVPIY